MAIATIHPIYPMASDSWIYHINRVRLPARSWLLFGLSHADNFVSDQTVQGPIKAFDPGKMALAFQVLVYLPALEFTAPFPFNPLQHSHCIPHVCIRTHEPEGRPGMGKQVVP